MQKVYDINEINLNIEFKQHVIIIHKCSHILKIDHKMTGGQAEIYRCAERSKPRCNAYRCIM